MIVEEMGTLEINDTQCNGSTSQLQNSKLSLLGHDGKQVVEYLSLKGTMERKV